MLLGGESAWHGFLELATTPVFLGLDVLLLFGLLFHGLNGAPCRAGRHRDRRGPAEGALLVAHDHRRDPARWARRSTSWGAVDGVARPDRNPSMTDRSRRWKVTTYSGVALLVLVTVHMVAHHFVVDEIGGLRTYAQVLDYIANPVILVIECTFLIVVTIHAMLGLRSVLFDFGLSERMQRLVSRGCRAPGRRDDRLRPGTHRRPGVEGLIGTGPWSASSSSRTAI